MITVQKTYLFVGLLFLVLTACKTSQNKNQNKPKESPLYGSWTLNSLVLKKDNRQMPGQMMGYPFFEFTRDGYRIKNLRTVPQPPADSVAYILKGDSIFYPQNPKIPASAIVVLNSDSLILENERVIWLFERDTIQ